MIDPAMAPGAIKTGMLAVKMALQQERDTIMALREAANKPAFDGKGSSDSHVGSVLDIDV